MRSVPIAVARAEFVSMRAVTRARAAALATAVGTPVHHSSTESWYMAGSTKQVYVYYRHDADSNVTIVR